MKILYGITKSNFGGAQRYVFDLAKAAKGAGHDVSVLCGGNGALVEKLHQASIRTISLPSLERDISLIKEWRSFVFIFKTLMKERPAIFHTNSSKMGGLGNLAVFILNLYSKLTAKNYKLKAVFTAHGWAFNEPRPHWQRVIIKIFVWLTILFSHHTICVSEKTRSQVAHWLFIKSKLRMIRNGLEAFIIEEAPPHTTFTVGTIAELHRIKGLDILLKAWQKFIKNKEAKLIIIGTGEEGTSLKSLARELNIEQSVEFAGYIDNARKHLKDFDVFILPSRSEALPYSILEAGFSGLPVIATRVGGIPEIIEDGQSGLLVNPENPESLLQALDRLAEDTKLRETLGRNLAEKVDQEFSLQKMFSETLNLYVL